MVFGFNFLDFPLVSMNCDVPIKRYKTDCVVGLGDNEKAAMRHVSK